MREDRAWPSTGPELERVQDELARSPVRSWHPAGEVAVGGVWFVSPTGSPDDRGGEPAWAAAVVMHGGSEVAEAVVRGRTGAGYRAGLLALREGPLLERAVRALGVAPDVLLVDATGRDHPRRAGLALHLGAILDLPTIGVTDRPLVATVETLPGPLRGDLAPLELGGVEVAALLRTRSGTRPVVVHAAWRTDVETVVAVVLGVPGRARTPEPLRRARRLARLARAASS